MFRPILILRVVLITTPAAALALSAPAAVRLAGGQVGLLESWLAAAGLLCPLLALAIAAGRAARRTLRMLAPSAGVPLLAALGLWAIASLPATAVLGAALKGNTHHRALGGATFAVLALVIHVAAALVAWRVTVLVLPRVRRTATRTAFAVVLAAAALLLVVVTLTGGALAEDVKPEMTGSSPIPVLLVDGALALAVTVMASALDVPAARSSDLAWVGGGALVFVMSVGFALAATSPALARRFSYGAPLSGAVAEVIGLSGAP
jgi:hypothetical protein